MKSALSGGYAAWLVILAVVLNAGARSSVAGDLHKRERQYRRRVVDIARTAARTVTGVWPERGSATAITVYTSDPALPRRPQHSLPGGSLRLTGRDFHPLDRASFAWRAVWQPPVRRPGRWQPVMLDSGLSTSAAAARAARMTR